MGAVVVRAAVSRDGYLAVRVHGGRDLLDWYLLAEMKAPGPAVAPDHDELVRADRSLEDVGAIVIGRRMFETALRRGLYPPPGIKVFVVTRTDALLSTRLADRWLDVTFLAGDLDRIIETARLSANSCDVVLPGGYLCGRAMDVGAIDLFRLDVRPVVLGSGTHLCGLHRDLDLSALSQQLPAHSAHHMTLSTRQ